MLKYDRCGCGEQKQARSPECGKCRLTKRALLLELKTFFRTQDELKSRIDEAICERNSPDEAVEYSKQVVSDMFEPETNETISFTAERTLPFFERAIRRQDAHRAASFAAQYRAWKWMLGHPDADTFTGCEYGCEHAATYARMYNYLRDQMFGHNSRWEQLTNEAAKGRLNETGHQSTAPQATTREAVVANGR